MLDIQLESDFLSILQEELIPAMGCTEPIALAFAAARAREILGKIPERLTAHCSGNIVKNVRCVLIPNSGGMVGIQAAVVLGAVGGDAGRRMEVLETITDEHRCLAKQMIEDGKCSVEFLDSEIPLHFVIEARAGEDWVEVETRHSHTNIVSIRKNGNEILSATANQTQAQAADRSGLSIEAIQQFCNEV